MDLAPNIKAVTFKERVRSDIYNNMKITCGAAVKTLVSLTAYIEDLTVVNAGRDIDLKRALLRNASSAAAL